MRENIRVYINEAKKQGLADGNLHVINLRRIQTALNMGIIDGSKEELTSRLKESVAMQDNIIGLAALRSMLEYISTKPIPISRGVSAIKYLFNSIKAVFNEEEGRELENLIEDSLDDAFEVAKDNLDRVAKRTLQNSE
ncbi:hypothetical protein [Cyclobacterium sp.]|uniref:hypothetical protein n=1 Tax=Cyclobacterium sp. TaxID=1966343 RepID=UPI0025BEFD49|nr:hypothetical protein [Cyclobacterium sp.]